MTPFPSRIFHHDPHCRVCGTLNIGLLEDRSGTGGQQLALFDAPAPSAAQLAGGKVPQAEHQPGRETPAVPRTEGQTDHQP
jgi:hypothetical protein